MAKRCVSGLIGLGLLAGLPTAVLGRGVSPYLPLNLEPEIESQIERVLILADEPVMTRPIAAATVLDALPKACRIDAALCQRVERYLSRYTHNWGVTEASLEGAAASGAGDRTVDPDRYGMREASHWDASAQVYVQPGDHMLLDLGAVAYEGRTSFTGSMVSLGWSGAQLDIGFRPHWFSPMSDSSMLMSTEAPTMPSVTLSNYQRLTSFGLHYELFAARMSNSDRIVFEHGFTSGHPRLAGFHLEAEPASGWSIGTSRLVQYGGGALGGSSIHSLLDAFFKPSAAQTISANHQAFGNQEASVTSSLLFPGKVPFSVYFEYAGEDTSRGRDYLLGNSSLSAGIHFPRLWQHFDLTLEVTEWQNAWYVHTVYLDGMTNYGLVTGNWFGDQRVFGDGVGGHSSMARLNYEPPFGGLIQLRYRTLQNQEYGIYKNYQRYQDVSLGYSRPWLGVVVGGEVDAGRDVFGQSFTRLAGYIRYDEGGALSSLREALEGSDEGGGEKAGELFVDVGANASRQNIDLTTAATRHNGPVDSGYHLALGARRFVSDHSDLGARLEFDNVQGHSLIGARLLDYRYRFNNPLTFNLFLGAARYDLATPAYGFYYGVGTQWRNVFPNWDLGADLRYANSVARDHLLPGDPPNVGARTDSFYNISSITLSISRHF
ncbi:MAG TPA: capsule assembly Wzi family protein [Steroidobacteraceae bacterium]|nr:capsule assembly Wzi family protein [Steroidobacteraceae bacterium]